MTLVLAGAKLIHSLNLVLKLVPRESASHGPTNPRPGPEPERANLNYPSYSNIVQVAKSSCLCKRTQHTPVSTTSQPIPESPPRTTVRRNQPPTPAQLNQPRRRRRKNRSPENLPTHNVPLTLLLLLCLPRQPGKNSEKDLPQSLHHHQHFPSHWSHRSDSLKSVFFVEGRFFVGTGVCAKK